MNWKEMSWRWKIGERGVGRAIKYLLHCGNLSIRTGKYGHYDATLPVVGYNPCSCTATPVYWVYRLAYPRPLSTRPRNHMCVTFVAHPAEHALVPPLYQRSDKRSSYLNLIHVHARSVTFYCIDFAVNGTRAKADDAVVDMRHSVNDQSLDASKKLEESESWIKDNNVCERCSLVYLIRQSVERQQSH